MPDVQKQRKKNGSRAAAKPKPAAKLNGDRPPKATELPAREAGKALDGRGKYVYCIVQADEPLRFGPLGIGAEPAEVHTINYKDIAAVVSDTPIEVHDPTRENVLAH